MVQGSQASSWPGSDWGEFRGDLGKTVVAFPASGRSPHSDALPGYTCLAGRLLEAQSGTWALHPPHSPRASAPDPAPCTLLCKRAKQVCAASYRAWGLRTPLPTRGGDTRPGQPSPEHPSSTLHHMPRKQGTAKVGVSSTPRNPFREGSLEGVRKQHPLLSDAHSGQGEPHPAARHGSTTADHAPRERHLSPPGCHLVTL